MLNIHPSSYLIANGVHDRELEHIIAYTALQARVPVLDKSPVYQRATNLLVNRLYPDKPYAD